MKKKKDIARCCNGLDHMPDKSMRNKDLFYYDLCSEGSSEYLSNHYKMVNHIGSVVSDRDLFKNLDPKWDTYDWKDIEETYTIVWDDELANEMINISDIDLNNIVSSYEMLELLSNNEFDSLDKLNYFIKENNGKAVNKFFDNEENDWLNYKFNKCGVIFHKTKTFDGAKNVWKLNLNYCFVKFNNEIKQFNYWDLRSLYFDCQNKIMSIKKSASLRR